MTKLIVKKKKIVAPIASRVSKVAPITKATSTSANKIKPLVQYNLFFGGTTVFLGLVFFFILLTFFLGNIVTLYLFKESIVHPVAKEYIWRVTPIETANGLVANENSTLTSVDSSSWNESEIMTLPDGVDNIASLNFLSSPDGSQFAYVTGSNNRAAVSLNGVIGPEYDKIMFMIFSPDSKRFAYGVKSGDKEAVVIDGEIQALQDWIFPPYFFTPDSKHFVYKARNSEGDVLMFDNQSGSAYDQIYNQFMSDDKKILIYYARKDNKIFQNTLEIAK
jgi:hypothetical protein